VQLREDPPDEHQIATFAQKTTVSVRLSAASSALDRQTAPGVTSSRHTRGSLMPKTEYLQGALDLLILRTLELGQNHGWGIQQRIRQVSRETLRVSQGSLYPALHRLEAAGLLASEMAPSANNRRARFYRLTAAGRRRLHSETEDWRAFALAMRRALQIT
jgi:PadR family transcriptional regulator, regulatory protein PadR